MTASGPPAARCATPKAPRGLLHHDRGRRRSGAPAGNRNAWKHGQRSGEVLAMRAVEKLLLRMPLEPDGL